MGFVQVTHKTNELPIKSILVLENTRMNLQFALPQHPVIGYRQIDENGTIQEKFSVVAHYTMIGNTANSDINIYEFRGVEIK